MNFGTTTPPFGRTVSASDIRSNGFAGASGDGRQSILRRLGQFSLFLLLSSALPVALHAANFVQIAAATPQSTTSTVDVTLASAETAGDFNVVVVGWNDTSATVESVQDSAGNSYKLAVGP